MSRLNIVRMIISPRGSHAPGLNVVGDDLVAIGERLVADSAFSVLLDNFPGEQPLHFRRRTQFAVAPRVICIFYALDAGSEMMAVGRIFATAAEAGVVDRTGLVSMKFHRELWLMVAQSASSCGGLNFETLHCNESAVCPSARNESRTSQSCVPKNHLHV